MSDNPSDNPYAQPPQTGMPPSGMPPGYLGPDPQQVQSKVTPPAIGLMVVGGLNVLSALWGLVSSAMYMVGVGPAVAAQAQQAEQMEELRAQGMEGLVSFMEVMTSVQGPLGLVLGIVQLLAGGFIIYGGLKMKGLQSYGLSLGSAIVAMIPMLSSCCCAGIPIGIWAIVILMDQAVKDSFARSSV